GSEDRCHSPGDDVTELEPARGGNDLVAELNQRSPAYAHGIGEPLLGCDLVNMQRPGLEASRPNKHHGAVMGQAARSNTFSRSFCLGPLRVKLGKSLTEHIESASSATSGHEADILGRSELGQFPTYAPLHQSPSLR